MAACIVVALVFQCDSLSAQTIRGKVIDAETAKPIPLASVFLNGTYNGTSTDTAGYFTIKVTGTNIPLIVSSVGYQTETVTNYGGETPIIKLRRKLNELDLVTVGSMQDNRKKWMKIFLTEFIGATNNDCVIINPDEIWFSYQKKTTRFGPVPISP